MFNAIFKNDVNCAPVQYIKNTQTNANKMSLSVQQNHKVIKITEFEYIKLYDMRNSAFQKLYLLQNQITTFPISSVPTQIHNYLCI